MIRSRRLDEPTAVALVRYTPHELSIQRDCAIWHLLLNRVARWVIHCLAILYRGVHRPRLVRRLLKSLRSVFRLVWHRLSIELSHRLGIRLIRGLAGGLVHGNAVDLFHGLLLDGLTVDVDSIHFSDLLVDSGGRD